MIRNFNYHDKEVDNKDKEVRLKRNKNDKEIDNKLFTKVAYHDNELDKEVVIGRGPRTYRGEEQ